LKTSHEGVSTANEQGSDELTNAVGGAKSWPGTGRGEPTEQVTSTQGGPESARRFSFTESTFGGLGEGK